MRLRQETYISVPTTKVTHINLSYHFVAVNPGVPNHTRDTPGSLQVVSPCKLPEYTKCEQGV